MDCEILFPKTSLKTDKIIFLVLFNPVFRFFLNMQKCIPTKPFCKSIVPERSFILECLILHPSGGTVMNLRLNNHAL